MTVSHRGPTGISSSGFVPPADTDREARHRVLVVDDTPAIHEDIRAVLCAADGRSADLAELEADLFGSSAPEGGGAAFDVDSAYQGQEALELVRSAAREGRPYSFAFVDMRMPPGWDGLETIPHLWEVDPHLEIVICTAFADYEWSEIADGVGYTDQLMILKKPFDAIEVSQLARALSAKRDLRAQVQARLDDLEAAVAERTRDLLEAKERLEQTLIEREQMEVELRHAQKLEAVGQLAAGIAHEINTPIQFVGDSIHFLGEAFEDFSGLIREFRHVLGELAKRPGGEPLGRRMKSAEERYDYAYLKEQVPQAVARAGEGVQRVAEIVRAMKEFAHPDQREKSETDLNHAIENALTVARNEYKYVAEISTDFGELPLVPCYPGDVNQVLLNLIVNAAHAIGDKVGDSGEKGTISIRTRCEDDDVVISVSDTGCGIPEDIRQKIFDPFFTTKEVGRGTGQGLAIARSCIVDKHGGTISVESEVGQGTTFHVRLPLKASGPPAEQGEAGVESLFPEGDDPHAAAEPEPRADGTDPAAAGGGAPA
ncbi:MAG: hybrid sensor histidine kinase/response regulator [Gemmatimonadetes bacterium]|nr:MAG: hybrid sensor histidine kinase/response regulator [Gemmatimonadota bacterium]